MISGLGDGLLGFLSDEESKGEEGAWKGISIDFSTASVFEEEDGKYVVLVLLVHIYYKQGRNENNKKTYRIHYSDWLMLSVKLIITRILQHKINLLFDYDYQG